MHNHHSVRHLQFGIAVHKCSLELFLWFTVESHGPLGQRTAVICLKDRATPRKYPRHPGVPSKMPL